MRQLIIILTLLVSNSPEIDYQKVFGSDYDNALKYFEKNKSIITAHFNYYSANKELLISVIFPERIRYSMIRDFLETTMVEMIYIDLGTDYVDFSIGDFQIKPSFAEKVEKFIGQFHQLKHKYKLIIDFDKKTDRAKRKERVRRLKSLNYQLIYISAFYDIVNQKFKLKNKSNAEQIKFLAAAYNHGFDSEKWRIEKYVDSKYFPYGTKYKGKQYAYSAIAVDFYLNYYNSIFK